MDKKPEHLIPEEMWRVQRHFQEEHPGFAERIITAALRHPQQQPLTVSAWLGRLCAEYQLPRPAFMFSLMLVMGIEAGFIAPINGDTTPTQDTLYVQEFLYEDEAML